MILGKLLNCVLGRLKCCLETFINTKLWFQIYSHKAAQAFDLSSRIGLYVYLVNL